jgi:hypothetical protein
MKSDGKTPASSGDAMGVGVLLFSIKALRPTDG